MTEPRKDIVSFGKVVRFYYGVHDASGRLVDRTEFGAPLTYLHGAGNIVPGLERALVGKAAGERVQVTLPPEEAYGKRDEAQVKKLPRASIPVSGPLARGQAFAIRAPDGRARQLVVVSANDQEVTVDLNHPFAGKTLAFDVTIDALRDATPDEMAHGHPDEDAHH